MPEREWPQPFCTMVEGAPIVGIERQAPGGGYQFPSFDQCCSKFGIGGLSKSDDVVHDGILRVRAIRLFYERITAAH
jgi:hypothetical protein